MFFKGKRLITIAGLVIAVLCALRFMVLANDYLTFTTDKTEATSHLNEILEGDEYIQRIHCDHDGLDSIAISFGTFDRINHSEIRVELLQEDELIQSWDLDSELLEDNTSYPLKLNKKQKNSNGRDYILRVISDAEPGAGITIYTNNGEGQSGLIYNGTECAETLCFQLTYRYPFAELWSVAANARHLTIVLCIAIFMFFLIPLVRKFSTEKLVLAIWIPLCCLFLFSNTIFNVPDENHHFFRALEISMGHPISDLNWAETAGGRELPLAGVDLGGLEQDWQTFSENKSVTLSEDLEFTEFTNTSLYSPVSYLPQSIVIFIFRNLSKNVALIAYAGRIANLLATTILMFLTLKLLPPKAKVVMGIFFLIPMNLYEAVSLSPDALVTALIAFMVAYVIHISYLQKEPLRTRQLILLYILAIAVSQMKIIYLPCVLVYFLIPGEKFGGRRNKTWHAVFVAASSVFLSLLWLNRTGQFVFQNKGANSSMQMADILHHPWNFLLVMARTFFESGHVDSGGNWLITMLGGSLNDFNVDASSILMLIYGGMLLLAFCRDRKPKSWSLKNNGVFILITVAVYVLLMTSLYLQWSPVGDMTIAGVQGRYFLPLLLLLYYAINPVDTGESDRSLRAHQLYVIAGINICACFSLLFASLAGVST